MSAELARRLLHSGAVAPDEIYAALLDVVVLGVPFVQALVARGAVTGESVEQELGRIRVPTLRSVRVAHELARKLPAGLCERLLCVPVGISETGEAEVACVDPLDPAVPSELGYHLGMPVRPLRAPLASVLLGIERWLDQQGVVVLDGRTPALGSPVVRPPSSPGLRFSFHADSGGESREPEADRPTSPFPLVQRPAAESRDTNPGIGTRTLPVPLLEERDEAGEPILGLTRSKPPSELERRPVPSVEQMDFGSIDRATGADELVRAVAELSSPLARSVWVFAMKSAWSEVRWVVPSLGERTIGLKLAAVESSVLDIAVRDGHFFGHLPHDRIHEGLRALIGDVEIYVVPVLVADRPALGLLLADLGSSLGATRAGDEIARRASVALGRILRSKKRG